MIPSIFGHLKTLPKHPKSSPVEDELSDFQKSRSHCDKGVYISLAENRRLEKEIPIGHHHFQVLR